MHWNLFKYEIYHGNLFEQIRPNLINIINSFIKFTTFCSLEKERITKNSNTRTVLSSNLQEKKESIHIRKSTVYTVSGNMKILRIHRDTTFRF